MRDSRSASARPIISVLLIASVLAGCSGGDHSVSTVSTATIDAGTSAATATTAAADAAASPAPAPTVPGTGAPSSSVAGPTSAPTPTVIATVPEADSVFALVKSRGDLTKFTQLLEAVDAPVVFQQARGITLLAPNDDAWAAYGDDQFQALLGDPTAASLVLSEHLSVGPQPLDALVAAGGFSNAMARTLPVVAANGTITIGGATVVEGDLTASNGVVHVIDSVIPPAEG